MYTEDMRRLIKKVEATRTQRLGKDYPRMTADERDDVLKKYHPEYRKRGFRMLALGVNKGSRVTVELADLRECHGDSESGDQACSSRAAWRAGLWRYADPR